MEMSADSIGGIQIIWYSSVGLSYLAYELVSSFVLVFWCPCMKCHCMKCFRAICVLRRLVRTFVLQVTFVSFRADMAKEGPINARCPVSREQEFLVEIPPPPPSDPRFDQPLESRAHSFQARR